MLFGMFFSLASWRQNSRYFFFCLVWFSAFGSSIGQVQQVSQIEIPLNLWDDVGQYRVLSAQQQGLVVVRKIFGVGASQLIVSKLDTALRKDWEINIYIPQFANLLQTQVRKNIAYLLLQNRTEFLVIIIQVKDGGYQYTPVKSPILFRSTEFSVTDDAVLIGGYYNQRPLVFYFNFKLGQSKILPGFYNEIGELNQLKTYDDGSIESVVSAKNQDKKKSLWVRNYSAEGHLLRTIILQPEADKNLLSGKSFQMADGSQIVLGTYGKYADYARGIFSSKINIDGESTIIYHNFGDLKRFFGFMKPNREKRVMERIEKRKLKGKKIRFNYYYLMHDIIPFQNEFILLGEVFYPHYTYVGSASFGGITSRSQAIFDGYYYTHAVAAGFSKDGNLLWDNSFKIGNVRSMTLDQIVKIQPSAHKLDMAYVYDNTLNSKTIFETDVIKNKSTSILYGNSPRNITSESSNLENWYDGYMFAYGALWVKNPIAPNGTQSSRRLFYITKIAFQ